MDFPPTEHLDSGSVRRLDGFGQTVAEDAYVYRVSSVEEILRVFDLARIVKRQVVLRGSGRSYGDASLLSEALAIDIRGMNKVISWDPTSGVLEIEAGATLEQVWRLTLPDGWWPPVVSGTMKPTLAGALAMNIHGKNAFRAGPIGEHVLALTCVCPSGVVLHLTPEDPRFFHFISSAGLLGVITVVKLQMKKVASGDLRVLALSRSGWDAQFDAFETYSSSADYMVSWVDAFARGRSAGRGLFHAGWYADGEPSTLLESHQDLPQKILGVVPKSEVWRLLRPLNNQVGMRLLNSLKHHSARLIGHGREHRQSLVAFSFLLDYVPDWRKAYLPGGFIQFQSFVPAEHARAVFASQVRMQQEAGLESFLAVLKRHRKDAFANSHGVNGYSLALDFKVTATNWPTLERLCHGMSDLVRSSNGRFYLAKDSILRPDDVELPQSLLDLKHELDPENLLSSALSDRLRLWEPRKPSGSSSSQDTI
ncbi:MAG: FAD-binding oxidoreductase [Fimbriimonas sp.]